MDTRGPITPGAEAQPAKKKRTLPPALAAYRLKKGEKLQKGQKRGATPAEKVTAANHHAVTHRVGLLEWLGL